jgi:cold shock CspA family protein
MRLPLQISFHGLEKSDFVEDWIRKEVDKLEQICDHLISCHVGIKYDQKRKQTGNPYRIRIEMRVPPGHNLLVTHDTGIKEPAGEVRTALQHAFKSARRRLKELMNKQQGSIKSHPEQEAVALVAKLFPEEGYGFIRTIDGDDVYFHKNSVLHGDFDRLELGTGVNFSSELGEDGLQATSVQVVNRPPAK